jgi:molybdopterin-guanine dinucleotide biosynthesis protein A
MLTVPAYILAGGQSRRFGSDKARALVKGVPWIVRTSQLLEPLVTEITVVAARVDEYADLGLRTIADIQPGLGPLGGLQTALSDLPNHHRALLLCPCDATILKPSWLEQLHALCRDTPAAVFRALDLWQPFPGFYSRECLYSLEIQLSGHSRSLQRFLDEIGPSWLPLPEDWPSHWQVNTPEELRQFAGES